MHVVLFASRIYGNGADRINIAFVSSEDNSTLDMAVAYLSDEMNVRFKRYDGETAFNALENRDVAAVLYVDDNNKNIRFIYYKTEKYLAETFKNLIDAGLSDYYIWKNSVGLIREYERELSIQEVNSYKDCDSFERELMNVLISRNSDYERVVFSDTGNVPIKYFYIGSMMAFIILLAGCIFIGFTAGDERGFLIEVRRRGVNKIVIKMAQYLPVIIIMNIAIWFFTAIWQLVHLKTFNIAAYLMGSLAVTALMLSVIIIISLAASKLAGMLSGIMSGIALMFAAGNIIPASYMYGTDRISDFIMHKWCVRALGQILTGNIQPLVMGIILIFIIVEIIIGSTVE